MFCPVCAADVQPRNELHPKHGVIKVCPENHVIAGQVEISSTDDAEFVDNDGESVGAVQFAVPGSAPSAKAKTVARKPAAAFGDLPRAVRDRKRQLRSLIKSAQRELAQLERLTRPERKPAAVKPIRREVAS